jgi:hypothetical protein
MRTSEPLGLHMLKLSLVLSALAGSVVGSVHDLILRDDVDHDRSVAKAGDYSGLAHLNFITPRGFREGEATLIPDQWLLTAAHVTRRLEAGHVISVGDEDAAVAEVIRHPDWRPGPGGGPDLALVRLASAIEETAPVELYTESDEVGQEVILLGLGDYGDGTSGPVGNDGRVRLATNRIDAVNEYSIVFDFDAPDSGEATEFEGVSGPGDSGGPALIETEDGVYLAGVSSGQERGSAAGRGRYGVIEHYTRVSRYADWIEQTLTRSQAGG